MASRPYSMAFPEAGRRARQSKEDVAGVKDDAVTSEVEVLDHGQAEMELT